MRALARRGSYGAGWEAARRADGSRPRVCRYVTKALWLSIPAFTRQYDGKCTQVTPETVGALPQMLREYVYFIRLVWQRSSR